MIDIAISFFYLFLITLFLCGAFFVLQLTIERFALVTLPRLANVYLRLRYPERYRNE